MLSAADLRCFRLTRAAEKAVSRQNGVVHTTLLGETAYAPSIDYWQRLVAELPQSVSHTRCLAASPSGPGCAATQRAVEPSSAHLCVAGPDVVYRRLHSRVLRDGSGLVCRLLSVSQTSGHHLSWLSQSLDRRCRHLSCEYLAAGVRRRIFTLFGDRLLYRGFHPFGCDGSRMECPRTAGWSNAWERPAKKIRRPRCG